MPLYHIARVIESDVISHHMAQSTQNSQCDKELSLSFSLVSEWVILEEFQSKSNGKYWKPYLKVTYRAYSSGGGLKAYYMELQLTKSYEIRVKSL